MSIIGLEIYRRSEETLVTFEEKLILGEHLADFVDNMA